MATILLVDDYPVTLRLLSYVLEREGHTVLTAEDAHAAFDLLNARHVDLLISDLHMPEVDGIALLRTVRADARLGALPVLMLTASGELDDRDAAEQAGATGFLTKPVATRQLLDTVDGVLGGG